jgi:hypothetical protein
MARKTMVLTLDSTFKRDEGKVFFIEEMDSYSGEMWGIKVMQGLIRSGVEIPDDIANMGLAGVARMSFAALGGMSFGDLQPLLDQMMACVKLIPDPSKPKVTRGLNASDIEEVKTRLYIKREVFKLHVDFLPVADPSDPNTTLSEIKPQEQGAS